MTSTWKLSIRSMRSALPRGWLVAVGACFALALAWASPIQAQTTYPVNGTVGFDNGLQRLATNLVLDHVVHLGDANPLGAVIHWGDGPSTNPGLLTCVDTTGGKNFPNYIPCDVYGTHRYASAGAYTIMIEYDDPPSFPFIGHGPRHSLFTTATISTPRDFVILSIGDSVASGEGDPLVAHQLGVTYPNKGFWDDPDSNYGGPAVCHRSSFAGPSLAAQRVIANNPSNSPSNSITYIHMACSGATVEDSIQQLRVARGSLPRIDVLTIAAGANDLTIREPTPDTVLFDNDTVDDLVGNGGDLGLGFKEVLLRCLEPFNSCSSDPNFDQDLTDSINGNPSRTVTGTTFKNGPVETIGFSGLPALYQQLDQEVRCINPSDGTQELNCTDPQKQIPKLVLIAEYHDPTHDKNGQYPQLAAHLGGCSDWGVTAVAFHKLHDLALVGMNSQIRNSPWEVVPVQDGFLTHGMCAQDQRWVVTTPDSLGLQNDVQGTAHPNYAGQAYIGDQIYNYMIARNPPVTTASATVGGTPYPFGTWTNQDVTVTLSAANGIKESGVKQTLYAVDDTADCQPVTWPRCSVYGGPFTISTSGKHTVTFDSQNTSGWMGPFQNVQVWVDKNPPLSSVPDTMTIPQGESASYTILLGHQGWAGQTINLSCTTDAQLTGCTMLPTSVTLDATNSNASVATVVTTLTGGLPGQAALFQHNPFGPVEALRFLLAFTMAAFLIAMARALRAPRWVRVTHFAALALLFGWLSAGCNSAAQIPGTPRGTYTVTITGTSGMTTNTVQTKLVVK